MSAEAPPRRNFDRLRASIQVRLAPLFEHGGWSLAWGIFLAVSLVVIVRPWLDAPDVYPEPASGRDSWEGLSKGGDFRAVGLLLLAGALLTAGSAWVVARAAGRGDDADLRRRTAHRVLLVAALPAIAWLARLLLQPAEATTPPQAAALWLAVGHLALWITSLARDQLDAARLQRTALAILGAAFVAQFLGAAVGLVPVRCTARAQVGGTTVIAVGVLAAALVLLVCAATARRARGDAARLERNVLQVALACQAPLALLLLSLFPPAFTSPFGGLHNEARWPLLAVAWAGVVGVLLAWARAWRSLRRALTCAGGTDPAVGAAAAWSLPALAALAIFVATRSWGVPVLPVDDWHFGERWTSWQQWAEFGKVPYVDTMPTFGLYGPMVGVLERLLFQPTVAGWLGADVILRALLAGASCVTAGALGGPAAAMFVSMWPAFTDRLAMLAPCLLLLASPRLLERPFWWLVCWPACCLAATAFNPASGAALVLASAPVAVWAIARGRTRQNAGSLVSGTGARALPAAPAVRAALVWMIVAVAAAVFTPAFAMARGFLDYVRSNGLLYSIHAGIAQALAYRTDAKGSDLMATAGARLLWLGGWLAIVLVLAAALARELWQPRVAGVQPDRSRVALAWMVPAACLLLSRWAITRIDLAGWTRSGAVTFTLLATLLPPLIARGRGLRAVAPALAVITALLAPFSLPQPAEPLAEAFGHGGARRIPKPGDTIVEGAQIGMPMLGMLAVDDRKHLAMLQDVRRLVDTYTQPGDPMFDLSNRPAVYGYTNRAMAARYASAYYLGNDRLQRQVLADLQRTPPKAVLFAPAITHGEGAATIRAYRVAKYLLLAYRPVERGDAVLLVPDHQTPADTTAADVQRELAARWTMLDRVVNAATGSYASNELGQVPASWGHSWKALAGFFLRDGMVQVTNAGDEDDQTWGLRFGSGAVAGRAIDFLKLDVEWAARSDAAPTIDVVWSNAGRQILRPLRLTLPAALATRGAGTSGAQLRSTLVVPVGAHPRWLLSPAVTDVVVKPTTDGMLPVFRVVGAEALRIRD